MRKLSYFTWFCIKQVLHCKSLSKLEHLPILEDASEHIAHSNSVFFPAKD